MIIWMLTLFLAGTSLSVPIAEWDHFEKAVRDQSVQKAEAKKQFLVLYKQLKNICAEYPFNRSAAWTFPVQGYGIKDVGAGGFKPNSRYGSSPIKGYDFFDGNKHGGHPAYDIFIQDKDRNSLDDASRQPVAVVAPVDLLILSAENGWKPESEIRGGNYVWALDPLQDRVFYFAHMNKTLVRAGDFCKAGSGIGTVGRSGKNAYPTRSATHLHLMVLKVRGGELIPMDFIPYLQNLVK